jgi:PAS domain S-box-containing protein
MLLLTIRVFALTPTGLGTDWIYNGFTLRCGKSCVSRSALLRGVTLSAPSQSALQAETEARLRFEMLLADVCAQFVNVAPSDVDSKIENAQHVICESLRVDHCSVWQVSKENPDLLVMTHVYRDPNLKPLPLRPSAKEYFPWGYNKILNKEVVCVPNTATLPPEAAKDKESWEQYGIHSSLVFPLSIGGFVIGVLAFDNMEEHDWPEPLQRRLQILAHIFAQALERKHVEQNVRAGEERLRLAQQIARIGSFEWNIQTGVNTWTPELEAMYGLQPGTFTGTQTAFENLVHVDDRAGVINLVDRALKTGQSMEGEWRVVWADGSVHWITGRWQALMKESGEAARMIGVNIDVTDRKRAEEEFRESEEKLRLLLDSIAEAIYGIDLEHRCTFCNPACLRTLGYERIDQVLGKHMHDLLHHSRADGTLFPVEECRVHRVTQTGEGVHAEDEVFWRANGTSFPTEYWSYPQRRGQCRRASENAVV